jgi:vacuolar-type H+-ATPase subunit I/STV1
MKWKDSGDTVDKEEKTEEEHFDEEQYSPWAEHKESKKGIKLGRYQVPPLLLALAAAALVAFLLILILNRGNDTATPQRIAALEQRLQQLEERLDKFEGIDEKVTAIWEQAKSFEKFKDRFDRSEASTSLRMDHLTMSLEALQKQIDQARSSRPAAASKNHAAAKTESKVQYHQIEPGDTLYSISKKYGLAVEELMRLNNMKPDSVLMPGQKLIVHK